MQRISLGLWAFLKREPRHTIRPTQRAKQYKNRVIGLNMIAGPGNVLKYNRLKVI